MADTSSVPAVAPTLSTTLPQNPSIVASPHIPTRAREEDKSESPSRKRRRSSKPPSIAPRSTISPIPLSGKSVAPPSAYTANVLTGAAAVIDEQRAKKEKADVQVGQISPNPARKAVEDLLASQNAAMSKNQDAPAAATLSEPLAAVAPVLQIASAPQTGNTTMQTSPKSTSSFDTHSNVQTATITTNGASVASPGQMDDGAGEDDDEDTPTDNNHRPRRDGSGSYEEGHSNKAFTFPGPLMGHAHRTSSLPQAGYGEGGQQITVCKETQMSLL